MFNSMTNRVGQVQVSQAMINVYNYMLLAVVASMGTSWLVSTNAALMAFFFTGPMAWVTLLSPLAFIFIVPIIFNAGVGRFGAVVTLVAFASLMGLSMSAMMAAYTSASIVTAFMGAAILFGTMSVYGYITKTNLEGIGQYLMVGLIAIIIASLVNIFLLGSSALATVISAIAIFIFLGLTAYDTQNIKRRLATASPDTIHVEEVYGAMSLYLDFINLFIHLLSLFGEKK